MSIRIRPANTGDLESLRKLMTDLVGHDVPESTILERLKMIQDHPNEALYVCEVDGEAEGALGFRVRENLEESSRYGEVSLLVTAHESREKGLGSIMLDFAEGLAREKGCIGTWLVSGFGPEERAHGFYARRGYRITGYRFVKPLEGHADTPGSHQGTCENPTSL